MTHIWHWMAVGAIAFLLTMVVSGCGTPVKWDPEQGWEQETIVNSNWRDRDGTESSADQDG